MLLKYDYFFSDKFLTRMTVLGSDSVSNGGKSKRQQSVGSKVHRGEYLEMIKLFFNILHMIDI